MIIESKIEKKLLHYVGKAIADYKMIQTKDRVLVCFSGGKDSFTLLRILHLLEKRTNHKFNIFALIVDQGIPNWNDEPLSVWLEEQHIPYEIVRKNTFAIVQDKIKPGKSFCPFCSRLRRGIIYRYAKENGFEKVALGHHRDDLIVSVLMSMFYSGEIRSMPPKLLTDDKRHIVIRPMVYCQEKDIIAYAKEQGFPVLSSDLCQYYAKATRANVQNLIDQLAKENPKVPSNILHALQNIKVSQLMDQNLFDYRHIHVREMSNESRET